MEAGHAGLGPQELIGVTELDNLGKGLPDKGYHGMEMHHIF